MGAQAVFVYSATTFRHVICAVPVLFALPGLFYLRVEPEGADEAPSFQWLSRRPLSGHCTDSFGDTGVRSALSTAPFLKTDTYDAKCMAPCLH